MTGSVFHRACRNEQGSTALEFALLFPAFAMFIFGFIYCAVALFVQHALQHGVQQAARCATVNQQLCADASKITKYASDHAYGLKPGASAFATTDKACGHHVSAKYDLAMPLPFVSNGAITLTAEACYPK